MSGYVQSPGVIKMIDTSQQNASLVHNDSTHFAQLYTYPDTFCYIQNTKEYDEYLVLTEQNLDGHGWWIPDFYLDMFQTSGGVPSKSPIDPLGLIA